MSDPTDDPNVQETQFTNNDPPSYGAVPPPQPSRTSTRALAPDLLRGLLMVLQAIDHSALSVGAWRHGVAIDSEADGQNVTEWNVTAAWICRTLTHLCAPGFVFLLGMGIVYFGRSRTKLQWSTKQMAWHFFIRGLVLAAVNQFIITLIAGRGQFWIINPILLALAIDYTLAGFVWLAINASEKATTKLLEKVLPKSDEERPLLNTSTATNASWHIHNALLLALTVITIGWNHWISPDSGRCTTISTNGLFLESRFGTFFDFWFLPLFTTTVMSPFPPLGWISFAFLGILYGRLVTSRTHHPTKINTFNALAGVILFAIFASTRLLHFGNLSEDCLHMPEHISHPHRNQYLASFRSFFYIVKYPPSFSYGAFTMSMNFFLLALFGSIPKAYASRMQPLMAYGTSALFFYITHLLLYEALGVPVKLLFGHEMGYKDPIRDQPAIGVGPTAPFWFTWLAGLAILYPACKWYGGFKARKGVDSVWRFF